MALLIICFSVCISCVAVALLRIICPLLQGDLTVNMTENEAKIDITTYKSHMISIVWISV